MKNEILKLKTLNAAYMAALEFDYCPEPEEWERVVELFEVGVSDKDLKKALSDNQGRRPDEIANEMSEIIKSI